MRLLRQLAVVLFAAGALAAPQSDAGRSAPPPKVDRAALIEAWGEPFSLDPPVVQPPIRPSEWMVLDEADVAEQDVDGLVARYVLAEPSAPPVESSESPDHGLWRPATMPDRGELSGSFSIAYSVVVLADPQIRMAALSGAALLFVNGEAFMGDPERRGYRGVPVVLHGGVNQLVVAGVESGFELELWDPPTRMVFGTWDTGYPRRVEPKFVDFMIPAFNASMATAHFAHMHYDRAVCADAGIPGLSEWQDGMITPPLGVSLHSPFLFDIGFDPRQWFERWDCDWALAPMMIWAEGDEDADRLLLPLQMSNRVPVRRPVEPRWQGVFSDVSHIVYGSYDHKTAEAALSVARYWQYLYWYFADRTPTVLSDDQFLAEYCDSRWASHVLFVGDLESNVALSAHVPELEVPATPDDDWLWILGASRERHEVRDRDIGIVYGSSARALSLAYLVHPFSSHLDGSQSTAARPGAPEEEPATGLAAWYPARFRLAPTARSGVVRDR